MRILLAAHAPWRPTGYGTPVMLLAKAFEKQNHRMIAFAIEERGPGLMEYEGLPVALPLRDPYGMDGIGMVANFFQSSHIISLFDPWVLAPEGYSVAGKPWYGWFPVDQDGTLPHKLDLRVKHMDTPVVYSQYAADRVPGAVVIPPPINLDIYKPGEKSTARKLLGIPEDACMVGMVGSNIPGDRKALEANIEGFAQFCIGRPDTNLLYIGPPVGAVNVPKLIEEYGIRSQAYIVDGIGLHYALSSNTLLAAVYNSLDVLLHASAAEGFGICMAEAMACGIPIIYADNTSQPEVTGGLGWAVTEMEAKDNPHGGQWNYPVPDAITEALAQFYNGENINWTKDDLIKQAQKFNPDDCVAKWLEVMG